MENNYFHRSQGRAERIATGTPGADAGFFVGIFPTVSYRKYRLRTVRLDLVDGRKGSSYAKHCILLIPLAAGNGFKKIPLPAPALSLLYSDAYAVLRRHLFSCVPV